MSFIVIIPARFASRRLPGKPLVDINGKFMVVRVMENAFSSGAERVIVATDNLNVIDLIKQQTPIGEICLTKSNHKSGTERIGEVITKYMFDNEQIIVNVQCDEPLILPKMIRQVADKLKCSKVSMITLAVPISSLKEALNINVVKVVIDVHNYALYFSRSVIPWPGHKVNKIYNRINNYTNINICKNIFRHIGIYAYRVNFIKKFINWTISPLEKIEILEQLRVLWHGEKIEVLISNYNFHIGVDTRSDLNKVRHFLSK